jgi:glycosyltransferase involved in cell wall biosynthesis
VSDKVNGMGSGICVVSRSLDSEDLWHEASLCLTALAQRLAVSGHSVTLLWIPYDRPDDKKVRSLQEHYKRTYGIDVELFEHSDVLIWRFPTAQYYSFGIGAYIRSRNFSDAFIPLDAGLAYYVLLAKETGVFEPETTIHVVANAPIDWRSEADRFFFEKLDQLRISFMEKYCAEQADRLILTSSALHQWMLAKGWKLSPASEVLPSLSPLEWDADAHPPDVVNAGPSVELVPLIGGRYRDGITLFCDALDKLNSTSDQDITVTFVGPFFKVLGEHSAGMYLRRGRRWRHAIRFARHLSLRDGIRHAKQVGAIAVIPNLENAGGYLVKECINVGVPFVATSVGGNREEVHDQSAIHSLCKPEAQELADLIASKARNRSLALPSRTEPERLASWSGILRSNASAMRKTVPKGKSKKESPNPLVSVIIVHHDRPQYLLQAISSILEQDYQNFEVILVDDGSRLPESLATLDRLKTEFERRDWKIIRAKNKYVGAARNTGVRASKGEFIIFADDDNALLPGAISTYVSAILKSEADVCTALCKNFYGDKVPGSPRFNFVGYVPLGGALDVSLIESCFGDTMSIYRRTVFDRVGYQLEKFGYMVEDYEFFVRICLAGLKIRVIPEPLFLYRISTQGRYRSSHFYDNQTPILRAFAKAKFAGLENIYSLVIGQNKSEYEKNSFRTNLGYSPSDRELVRLCDMEPNEDEAIRLLAKIAAKESRPETAIGLISSLGSDEVVEEIAKVSGLSNPSWDAVKAAISSGSSERVLGLNELRTVEIRSTAPDDAIPMSYVEPPDRLFIEATDGFASVALLSAGCPTATSAITCRVSLPEVRSEGAEFLLMLCAMHDDPLVKVGEGNLTGSEGCSGWTKVVEPSAGLLLEARLSTPSVLPMNLLVAVRTVSGGRRAVLGCFESLRVHVALEDRSRRRPRIGPPAHRLRARNWTNDERMSAKVIQSYPSTLPALLFPREHEGGVFLRPAKTGPVVAVIEEGFPAFARQLLAQVEIAHEEAPAIEFALALSLPTNKVEWRIDGPKAPVAFSGWVSVEERFKLQDVSVRVMDQLPMALTISLAVRFPRGSRSGLTNAFFRNLQFLWEE